METFASADRAVHECSARFGNIEDGKKILWKLRTQVLAIIAQKMSKKDAENEMNNINLNIYMEDNMLSCKIGKGGTLLVINIIGNEVEYIWNESFGKVIELSDDQLRKFREAIGG